MFSTSRRVRCARLDTVAGEAFSVVHHDQRERRIFRDALAAGDAQKSLLTRSLVRGHLRRESSLGPVRGNATSERRGAVILTSGVSAPSRGSCSRSVAAARSRALGEVTLPAGDARSRSKERLAAESAVRVTRVETRKTSNQAMQLTASKPAIYAGNVCRRERMLRGMHLGLAAADLESR